MRYASIIILVVLAIAAAGPAGALRVIYPEEGATYTGAVFSVAYDGAAGPSCTAGWNGGNAIALPGCANFTFAAREGANTVWIDDGTDRVTVSFTVGSSASVVIPNAQVPAGGAIAPDGPTGTTGDVTSPPVRRASITPSSSTLVPEGMVLRGRTPYAIASTTLTPAGGLPERVTRLGGRTGAHRVELEPIGGRVRRVVLNDVVLPQAIDLGLEELPSSIVVEGRDSVDGFAIDPTRVTFSNGTVTKTAIGNRVWKCADWAFDNQTCLGEWVLVAYVTPGTPYDVVFDAVDPAYVESFDAEGARDVDATALGNSTIVIAFIDSGSNQASFEIWHTNGLRLVDETDIDTTVDAASRIAVDAINATHFSIAVVDGPEDDVDFFIYDRSGNQVQAQTQIDAAAGVTNTDVDICQLGDRFAMPWADSSDNDANFEIWSNAGTQLVNELAVDTTITPGASMQNLVACAAINSTHWMYAFYDDADNDVTLAGLTNAGATAVAATDLDINVGETGQVAATGMRNDRAAIAFYDSTDDDITITVRGISGAAFTSVLAVTDIDTNAGTDSRVAVAEIEVDGTSDFVVAWQDTSDTTIKAAVYDNSGAQVTAPFNVTKSPNTTSLLLDLAGYDSNLGIGLCNGTFAIVYSNSSGNASFETYHINGTRWDGTCGTPDTEPPIVTQVHPPNGTTNTTANVIDFIFNITDQSAIANCTLLIDGVDTASIESPLRNTNQNITIFLNNGEYEWAVSCTDAELLTNTTANRTIVVDVPILISGADTDLAALDNTTLVIAYIDSGENDASFEIWHTNGTLLVPTTDVDTTVDADSRIDVAAINTTHFTITVVDGPEDDVDFYIYNRTGSQIVGQTQVDASAGVTNTDVGVCQLGDRFATPYADSNDGDANYRIWSNAGASLMVENQVDISIAPGAALQNLVSCATLNTTHWMYAFYDDTDNDASLAVVDNTGTIIVAAVDLDINVGETGQIAATGMRNARAAVAFYDSTDQDITITVRSNAGAAMTTVLAVTDIDLAAGANSRLSAAEIESDGSSLFVVAWQDTSDTTIKAAVYDNGGTQVTAPFTVSAVPSATNLLLDVAGFDSNLGIGLCNGTFAIAYTNSSGNTLFETYHSNGSRWDGVCGDPPTIDALALPGSVVLNAGTTKQVLCNVSASDPDGGASIIAADAVLFHESVAWTAADDPRTHHTNGSCAVAGTTGVLRNFTCSFWLPYYALNGTWNCTATVTDVVGMATSATANISVDPLYALNVTSIELSFGNVSVGSSSATVSENLTNLGNQRINISVYGYGGVLGDNVSFRCPTQNLTIGLLKFAENATATYDQKRNLSSSLQSLGVFVLPQTDTNIRTNISYWQMSVPALFPVGYPCNGTVVFQADAG